MEKYLEQFSEKIRTKEELINFLGEINRIKEIVFKGKGEPLSKRAGKEVGQEFKDLLERLEERGLIPEGRGRQSAFWEELEKKLQSLPQISLEIAFSPSGNFLDEISQWFEKELGQKIILNITYNPKVVAGAVIEYRGNWRDFSLAKEIDKLMHQK